MTRTIGLLAGIALCLLATMDGHVSAAGSAKCRVSNISPEKRTLSVNCEIGPSSPGRRVLRFLDEFAGIRRLSDRISSVRVTDANGATLPIELRGNGVFAFQNSDANALVNLRYEVNLSRALDPGQYALTSSLGAEAAFLLAADLFPHGLLDASGSLRVEIEVPSEWVVATTERSEAGGFEMSNLRDAVFFLGRLRTQAVNIEDMRVVIAVAGKWEFSDSQIVNLCESVARAQRASLDGRERGTFLVTLAPFPLPMTGLRSAGLARARSVILMLNEGDDRVRTLRLYQRHVAHEMFHFYLPNAFRIKENFDWFWEGFTRYLGLVTLVETKAITLNELLMVVGDEYEAYLVNPARSRTSIVSASPEKFADAANYEIVYRKGLVVAALYDFELRWQSRGKASLNDVVRRLYQGYARLGGEVGNREVLDELRRSGDFGGFITDYVEGVREIALPSMLETYGIVIERVAGSGRPRLAMSSHLSGRQRAFVAGFEK